MEQEMQSQRTPKEIAADETFWFSVQQAFKVDPGVINLNNATVSPSPMIVEESMRRYLELSNLNPPAMMWGVLGQVTEGAKKLMARTFGCDPGEVAFTRNSSEAIEICQFGFDLEPGDEVLTTTQDYGRFVMTFQQRERRDGIVLKLFSIPAPIENPDEVVDLFEENITARTKMILVSHMTSETGQILPVRDIVRMARKKNIPVIVDGAQSFGHIAFTNEDLECDYFGSSLHKWLHAPWGSGLLYVRKSEISSIWPLYGCPAEMDDDIGKFEFVGTVPMANRAAIGDALSFYLSIGPKNKEERLRYLKDRWAEPLAGYDNVRFYTSLDPSLSCGIALVRIEGVDCGKLSKYLGEKANISSIHIKKNEYEGLRFSPSIYTRLDQIDTFAELMDSAARHGIPGY